MLEKRDSSREKKIIEELVSEDEILRKQHEIFKAEMAFKQELINARKAETLTQKVSYYKEKCLDNYRK